MTSGKMTQQGIHSLQNSRVNFQSAASDQKELTALQ